MTVGRIIVNNLQDFYYYCTIHTKWIGLLFIVLLSAYYVLTKRKSQYKFPPGPTGIPFLGYLPFLGKLQHKTLADISKKYGPVFSLFLGRQRIVFLNDWESMKDAMGKNVILDRTPGILTNLPSGLGFASASGQEWSDQRRFSVKIMKDIGLGRTKWEEMLQEEAEILVNRLEEHKGLPVDVFDLFASTFTNNITSLVFGEHFSLSHRKYVTEMVDLTMHEIKPIMWSVFLPTLRKLIRAFGLIESSKRKLEGYDQFLKNQIEKRLQDQKDDSEDTFVKRYNEELQNKLKNGENTTLTEPSLISNTGTLILGGSETTRNGMLWQLIAMAEHQEVQSRVHQELDSVLGRDGDIKWVDRTNVPYTFASIIETQRWKTVSPIFLMRMASEDTTILGYDIPKGTSVTVNTWALHNDPKYWPHPEKYDPTRMLLDGGAQVNFRPESYNAFSFGRRNCPGEMIALMEILVYFTKIMQKFKVLPEEGLNVKHDVLIGLTNQPTNFKLRFVPRE